MRRMRHLKPREIQGCTLALDASIPTSLYDATSGGSLVAADGAVARWEDQSGNARHVTQGTLANRPLRRSTLASGYGALDFGGANYYMLTDSLDSSSFFSASSNTIVGLIYQRSTTANNCFIAAAHTNLSGGVTFWATYGNILYFDAPNNNARVQVTQPADWDNAFNCVSGIRDGSTATIRNRGKQLVSAGSKTGSVSYTGKPICVGAKEVGAYWDGFSGFMSVVAIFSRALPDHTLLRLDHALMRKTRVSSA